MKADNKVYGIDFGNSYVRISRLDFQGEAIMVKNLEGDSKTPAIVGFGREANGDIYTYVGEIAKELEFVEPESICSDVRRRMGVDVCAITYAGEVYAPEQVAALILRKVVKDAEEILETEIKDVVITYPIYYGAMEKMALKNAVEIAGLNMVSTVTEPIAAALGYGMHKKGDSQAFLVYDLGGTEFNATVLRNTPNGLEGVALDGDHMLGGKNWDGWIAEYMERIFREKTGYEGEFHAEERQDLMLGAERVKWQLTAREKTKMIVQAGGIKARLAMTRKEFEDGTWMFLQKTLDTVECVLLNAERKGIGQIGCIVLAGGSCNMPQVKAALERAYPDTPVLLSAPEEAIVKGAAYYNDDKDPCGWPEKWEYSTTRKVAIPVDVRSSRTYGIKVGSKKEEKIQNLILKGDSLPKRVHTGLIQLPKESMVKERIAVYISESMQSELPVCQGRLVGYLRFPYPKEEKDRDYCLTDLAEIDFHISESGTLKIEKWDRLYRKACQYEAAQDSE